jgi:hypothetical protein
MADGKDETQEEYDALLANNMWHLVPPVQNASHWLQMGLSYQEKC